MNFNNITGTAPTFTDTISTVADVPKDPLVNKTLTITIVTKLANSTSNNRSVTLPLLTPRCLSVNIGTDRLRHIITVSSKSVSSLPRNNCIIAAVHTVYNRSRGSTCPTFNTLAMVIPVLNIVLTIVLFSVFWVTLTRERENLISLSFFLWGTTIYDNLFTEVPPLFTTLTVTLRSLAICLRVGVFVYELPTFVYGIRGQRREGLHSYMIHG